MIYLNQDDLQNLGMKWDQTVDVIDQAVRCLAEKDYAQPIKPYLRYRNLKNRIIAMPSFVGGNINIAGIKWIASFPDNIHKNIPRAHSVVILNDSETGEPVAIINTAVLSIIRTASVSGLMLKYYNTARPLKNIKLGIIGWGPIGQYHFKMVMDLFGSQMSDVFLYDLRPIISKENISPAYQDKVVIANSWEEVYENADIFITCTVSDRPYIDQKPKSGSLILNVSLRDFKSNIYDYVGNSIIVDDWEEVCRENTDIENMHIEKGLKKENTYSLVDVVCKGALERFNLDETIMFNPMGMSVFDMAIGSYYMQQATNNGIGTKLK